MVKINDLDKIILSTLIKKSYGTNFTDLLLSLQNSPDLTRNPLSLRPLLARRLKILQSTSVVFKQGKLYHFDPNKKIKGFVHNLICPSCFNPRKIILYGIDNIEAKQLTCFACKKRFYGYRAESNIHRFILSKKEKKEQQLKQYEDLVSKVNFINGDQL